MTDDELIAKQTRQIANLEEQVRDYRDSAKRVVSLIYGIGGPLNDNKLGYTKDQMLDWTRVIGYIEWVVEDEDNEK
jgi:hypothetical protein